MDFKSNWRSLGKIAIMAWDHKLKNHRVVDYIDENRIAKPVGSDRKCVKSDDIIEILTTIFITMAIYDLYH